MASLPLGESFTQIQLCRALEKGGRRCSENISRYISGQKLAPSLVALGIKRELPQRPLGVTAPLDLQLFCRTRFPGKLIGSA